MIPLISSLFQLFAQYCPKYTGIKHAEQCRAFFFFFGEGGDETGMRTQCKALNAQHSGPAHTIYMPHDNKTTWWVQHLLLVSVLTWATHQLSCRDLTRSPGLVHTLHFCGRKVEQAQQIDGRVLTKM